MADQIEGKPTTRDWLLRGLLAVVFLPLIFVSVIAGLELRRWAWDVTAPARFSSDMERNFRFGRRGVEEGYFNVYENVFAESDPGDYDIDYPPLRLLTFDLWLHCLNSQKQDVSEWDSSYQFNEPLLIFNTCMEAASALAVFLIIRRWTRREDSWTSKSPNWGSWIRAIIGAAIVWFSPGAMADGHGWASYDVWIPPFFLWGLLFVSYDCWVCAGIALGIGAMFKGQMLLAAPLFFVWPLLAGQPARALRCVIGFLIATATVAAPFILSSQIGRSGDRELHRDAISWVGCVIFAAIAVRASRYLRKIDCSMRTQRILIAIALIYAAALVLWPLVMAGNHRFWPMLLIGSVLYLTAAWFVRTRWFALVPFAGAAASVFGGMALFANSPAWWTVGFEYGAGRFYNIIQGPNANLPALLFRRFNWHELDDIAVTIPAHTIWHWPAMPIDVTTRHFLVTLYFIGLSLCCIATAVQWRRQDRRFLGAASTVWLMFYCLLPQMIGRYLLFGATVGAVVVAESFGLGLLVIFLNAVAAMLTLQAMSVDRANDEDWQTVGRYFQHTSPDIAWAILFIAAVFLFVSFNFSRRRRRVDEIEGQNAERLAALPIGRELD